MRDSTPSRMIQQQMYARERRGIFRSTEGYDTIAKSSGLEASFVKKVLHPFCVYDAPTELATRGEKDGSAYPETMHLLHLDNGDVLLGRSVYQAADFTGLRSAFFTHNFIIPSGHSSKPASDYMNWLQAAFADQYNIDSGTEIAELLELPIQSAAAIKPSARSILSLLNISEKSFKQLLYAVMAAVGGKKKIYVSLDVPIKQLPDKAKQLLSVLYASLPYAFRKQLGFITYAKEPVSRKSVHLTFVEQGSLRHGDRSIEKDFTFDFGNDRMMNVDLDGIDQPFLDFAWDNLDRPDRTDSFFQFAELMLADMGEERELAAASYHELCVVYQIEEGNEKLYESHKSAVMRSLMDYLQPSGALDAKMRLNDLFLSRFDYEFDRARQGVVPETFIVDVFTQYYQIEGKHIENKLVSFFLLALINARKQSEQDAAASFYAAVESNPDFSIAFFTRVLVDAKLSANLFIPFLEQKLKAAAGAKSVLQLIEQWGNAHPKLYGDEDFFVLVRQQLIEKLKRERHSLPATSKALEQLRSLASEGKFGVRKQLPSHDAVEFYTELELAAYRAMLIELDMERLTKDQLMLGEFLKSKDQLKKWNGQLSDPRQKSAALELQALYECFAFPEPTVDLFENLSPAEIDRVQLVGRRLLANQLELAEFPRLVLLFLRSSDMESVDYATLLNYLQQNASQKDTVYLFFRWAEKHPSFMRSRGFVPAYVTAVVSYFTKHDRDAFKKRANWKQHFDKAGPILKGVYKQAERELSSPLTKFFRRNRKSTFITSLSAIGIVLIVAGIMFAFGGKDDVKPGGAVLPETTPEPSITQPDTIVYVEQNAASVGKKAATTLVFAFKEAAACGLFKPSSLTVETPGAEAVSYTTLEVTSDCKSDTGSSSTDGNQVESSSQPTETTDSTAKESDKPTPTPTPAETDSLPTATDSQTEQPSNTAINEADYTNRVVVNLGKQVDIPEKSIITVGESKYEISVLRVVAP
ncbi:glycosyltransferase [Paenibacillus sp. 2TAB26]